MSGTVVRSIDHQILGTTATENQEIFTNLYNFFQQHVAAGNAALHASNFGAGGTGFDFHDGANPSGENAWACFRFLASASTLRTTDFYVLIQWADVAIFGTAPGNPGQIDSGNGDGVALMMAYREGGASPWNGTTGAPGADTKGSPVWAGADLHVLERSMSNPLGGAGPGAHVALTENMVSLADAALLGAVSRQHFVGDADTIFLAFDVGDTGQYNRFCIFGAYVPLSGLAVPNPYFLFRGAGVNNPDLPGANTWGDIGGGGTRLGGVIGRDQSRDVGQVTPTWLASGILSGTNQPNRQYLLEGAALFDAMPIFLVDTEGSNVGLVGQVDTTIVAVVWGQNSNDTNPALTRMYLGSPIGITESRWAINWDGATVPGTTGTRNGVQS